MHGIWMEYAWNMHGICMEYAANHRFPSFSRLSETYHFLIQNLSIRLISALGVPRSRFAFLDTVEKVKNTHVLALADENLSFSDENVDFLACRAEWASPASHEY